MHPNYTRLPYTRQDVSRFWSKTAREGECIRYIGSNQDGDPESYGRFWAGGRQNSAHRFAWEITHGWIPEGLSVCHTCDHRWCVNPLHLWLGTTQDNAFDSWVKGRRPDGRGPLLADDPDPDTPQYTPKPAKPGANRKLTDEDVAQIRARFVRVGPKRSNAKELAAMFGVGTSHIHRIVRGGRR